MTRTVADVLHPGGDVPPIGDPPDEDWDEDPDDDDAEEEDDDDDFDDE